MRLSAIAIVLSAFGIGAIGSVIAARTAVEVVEDRSVRGVRTALDDGEMTWASVQGDGLQIVLEGTAPTEAQSFRAISTAGTVVDASRVIDNMQVADTAEITPPHFSIEMLRNDSGVMVIGLIPASESSDEIIARAALAVDGDVVTDLLQIADYPTPAGWSRAVNYGLRALEELGASQISIDATSVEITAISANEVERAEYLAVLERRQPDNIEVTLNISAPRPVITPFTLRFIIDDKGARFDACSSDSAATSSVILSAARSAGWSGADPCTLGLGIPSRNWGDAIGLAISALSDIGGGSVTFSDADVTLVALEGTAQDLFDREIGELENDLPEVFALTPILPETPEANAEGPATFTATKSPEGNIQLRGRVSSALMNDAVANFARARLGNRDITLGTRVDESLPQGWSVRVLAAVDALAELSNGAVVVEPQLVTVRGNTGRAIASAEIARLLSDKLGEDANFEIDVEFVQALALTDIAAAPTAEDCIAGIEAVTSTTKIVFEPGSATIDASVSATMGEIADILKRCNEVEIEVAGYTDSQGREVMNQQLSQQRAEAVLAALRARRVPTSSFTAVGYGESDPIADNDTEEGREANRRIEFHLIEPEEPEEQTTALEELAAQPETTQEETEEEDHAAGEPHADDQGTDDE